MRPDAPDIAIPPFPPRTEWVGAEPLDVVRLAARGPVLVHFICAGDLNSVRTLPYVRAWQERYAPLGLTVLGVNTPRFPYTAEPAKLAAALERLEVRFPVALDATRAIWRDYGCRGWPSLFLWGMGGALRWFHFGEGEYAATEAEVQEAVLERDVAARLPEPLDPARPTDAPGALVRPPSPESFPGGSPDEPWVAGAGGDSISLEYEAGGVSASVDGEGELAVSVDGEGERRIAATAPGVYELASHPRHERHTLTLRPSPTLRIHAISFAAGLA